MTWSFGKSKKARATSTLDDGFLTYTTDGGSIVTIDLAQVSAVSRQLGRTKILVSGESCYPPIDFETLRAHWRKVIEAKRRHHF